MGGAAPRRDLPVSSSRWSGFGPPAVHVHSRCSSSRTCTSFNFGFFLTYSTLATCPRQQPRHDRRGHAPHVVHQEPRRAYVLNPAQADL